MKKQKIKIISIIAGSLCVFVIAVCYTINYSINVAEKKQAVHSKEKHEIAINKKSVKKGSPKKETPAILNDNDNTEKKDDKLTLFEVNNDNDSDDKNNEQEPEVTHIEITIVPDNPLTDDEYDVEYLHEKYAKQFYNLLNDPQMDLNQFFKISTDLVSLGLPQSLALLVESYRQMQSDDPAAADLLKAIARAKNPDLIGEFDKYIDIALNKNDIALLHALSQGLANIDMPEALVKIASITISDTHEDVPHIVGESIARVRNTQSIPILAEIINEKMPGYHSAIEAMLHMGDVGVTQLFSLIENEKGDDLDEDFIQIIEKVEYDANMYATFERMSSSASKHYEKCMYAMDQLERAKY